MGVKMNRIKVLCLATALLSGIVLSVCSQAEVPRASNPTEATPRQKSPELLQLEIDQATLDAEVRAETARAEAEARAKSEQEAKVRAEAEARAKQAAESAVREKQLSDAEALMRAGWPADAYALLLPSEFERAGEKRFDYLLGIAALDSGKPDKATLAFERVLAVDPNFAGARLDMARAYYQLGDLARAKTEFESVMKQNPPQEARITIQKYLDAISAREQAERTRITAYFEEALGHDSNVNGATSQAQIPVPAFGNLVFTLNQSSLKTPDYYGSFAGGAEVNHLLNANLGLYAGADLRLRGYPKHNQFSSIDLAAHAGAFYDYEGEVFRLGFIGDQYRLGVGYKPNRDTSGITAEWRHPSGPSDQLTVFGQFTQNRFVTSGMETQDHNLVLFGESWLHVIADGKSVVFGSFFGGREVAVAAVSPLNPSGGRPDGNKALVGLRVGSQITLSDAWDCFAGIGVQRGKYNKENLAFLSTRNDTMWDWNAGASWHVDKDWTVRTQLTMTRNQSNIAIYSFDRTDVSVLLRRDFR